MTVKSDKAWKTKFICELPHFYHLIPIHVFPHNLTVGPGKVHFVMTRNDTIIHENAASWLSLQHYLWMDCLSIPTHLELKVTHPHTHTSSFSWSPEQSGSLINLVLYSMEITDLKLQTRRLDFSPICCWVVIWHHWTGCYRIQCKGLIKRNQTADWCQLDTLWNICIPVGSTHTDLLNGFMHCDFNSGSCSLHGWKAFYIHLTE